MRRNMTGIALAALFVVAAMPATAAHDRTVDFGYSLSGYDAMTGAGARPDYAQVWVGKWVTKSGWGGFEDKLREAKARDVTLVVEWYYWADRISVDCVKYGCSGRSVEEWYRLTDSLAKRIAQSGAEAVVVVETEFNKGGITRADFAPTFDKHLRKVEDKIRDGAPGTKIVLGFGNWGLDKWERFPKAIAGADYIGFQAMRGSTRDSLESYLKVDNKIEETARFIKTEFGKPSMLHDLSLSSYPHSTWKWHQAEAVKQIFGRMDTLAELGVEAVVWRQHKDSLKSFPYYHEAEGYMGLYEHDGDPKPAQWAWVKGVKAHRA